MTQSLTISFSPTPRLLKQTLLSERGKLDPRERLFRGNNKAPLE